MISQTHNFCPISNMDSNSRSRGKGRERLKAGNLSNTYNQSIRGISRAF